MPVTTPTLSIIPSTDAAFREHVERLMAKDQFATAGELAARLRQLFPRVVVRPSEVSGQADTWYVYRDGVWRSSADPEWWLDPRTPRVVVSREGWITEANVPARAILGLAAADELPRFFADFAAPGTLDDSMALFAVLAAGRELTATTLLRPTSGDVIACDLRAWSDGDRILGAFRLADDIAIAPTPHEPPTIQLACEPASDTVFGGYARVALARMPEPTPDGLQLRLRRLYPHARVEGGPTTWRVLRDAGEAPAAAGDAPGEAPWWLAEDLATVRYDGQGRITEANGPARVLLGDDVVGRHWQDLVTAGTTEQVAEVMRLIAEQGSAVSRFRMPGADGYLFEFDSYTEVHDDTFTTIMRARSA